MSQQGRGQSERGGRARDGPHRLVRGRRQRRDGQRRQRFWSPPPINEGDAGKRREVPARRPVTQGGVCGEPRLQLPQLWVRLSGRQTGPPGPRGEVAETVLHRLKMGRVFMRDRPSGAHMTARSGRPETIDSCLLVASDPTAPNCRPQLRSSCAQPCSGCHDRTRRLATRLVRGVCTVRALRPPAVVACRCGVRCGQHALFCGLLRYRTDHHSVTAFVGPAV